MCFIFHLVHALINLSSCTVLLIECCDYFVSVHYFATECLNHIDVDALRRENTKKTVSQNKHCAYLARIELVDDEKETIDAYRSNWLIIKSE
jgi:hypothetical protein